MHQLLNRFQETLAYHGLQPSNQAVLTQTVIALDDDQRKLLVQQHTDSRPQVIDLDAMRSCVVKKQYGAIRAESLKKEPLHRHLLQVSLCFIPKAGGAPAEILFYHRHHDTA